MRNSDTKNYFWEALIMNKNPSNFYIVEQKSKLFNSINFGQFFFKVNLLQNLLNCKV